MCIYFLNIFIRGCNNLMKISQILFVNIQIFHCYEQEAITWTIVVLQY